MTNRLIKAGEQLGFNYGFNYWLAQNKFPQYFDILGDTISPKFYRRTFGTLIIDDFTYTGNFTELTKRLQQTPSSFMELNNLKQKKSLPTITIEKALLNAKAIYGDEVRYANFNAKAQRTFSLEEYLVSVARMIKELETIALEFNRLFCTMHHPNKGYWTFSTLKEKMGVLPDDYRTGTLNSKFFNKKGPFNFVKKPNVSSYEACLSLLAENAFGVIDETIWETICALLTVHKHLDREVFDFLSPELILSNKPPFRKLFNSHNRYGSNEGGFVPMGSSLLIKLFCRKCHYQKT